MGSFLNKQQEIKNAPSGAFFDGKTFVGFNYNLERFLKSSSAGVPDHAPLS